MKSRKNRMKGRYTNMKRDFLKDLGLEKEAIDSIMEENGKDIEAAKGDVKSLESKISTLESDNATLKKQVEDRDSQLETLKNSTGDVEAALTGAKAKNNTAVKALLKDLDKAEFAEDGTIKGLAEQIEVLKPHIENIEELVESDDVQAVLDAIDDVIVDNILANNDEPDDEGIKLQKIYDEIFNENL